MKALVWKEWRENSVLIPASALLMAVLFVGMVSYLHSMRSDTRLFVNPAEVFQPLLLLFWSIPAALCSASMVASEVGNGTLQFLSSIPASRSKVWWAKALTAACITALSFAVSAAIFIALYFLFESIGLLKQPFVSAMQMNGGVTIGGLLVAAPIFAVGTVATVLADRTIKALLLLLGLAAGFWFVLYLIAESIQNYLFDRPSLPVLIAVAIVLCLVYSNRTFVTGETLKTSRRFTILLDMRILDFFAVLAALVISYLWLIR